MMLKNKLDQIDPETTFNYDKELVIAVGANRQTKKWLNKTFLISEFVKKLSVTKRTDETIEEYMSLSKNEQDEIKDSNGAFVGAMLKGGSRRKSDVANRTCITMDLDYATPKTLETIKTKLPNTSHTLYSTHKNQPKSPRFRLLVWTDRTMAVDEYQAVARKVADEIGIEFFDMSGMDSNRLYYFPTTPSDAGYVFYHNDAPFLPVDSILSSYGQGDAWRNVSSWPRSSRETANFDRLLKKQADPLTKPGIVGAYCRVVSIQEAIEKELSDVYRKEARDRYTYIDGTSSNGLVIYDNKWAYSNHTSDPACGQLCNSFDLVRIHKFAHLDERARDDTPMTRLPSYQAMSEFVRNVEGVKRDLIENNIEIDASAFDAFKTDQESDEGWTEQLEVSDQGVVRTTFLNAALIVAHDPALKDQMRYSEFALTHENTSGEMWSTKETLEIREYIGRKYKVDFPAKKIEDGIETHSYRHSYHPVRDYLNDLKWDGIERIETMFIDYFGCEDNPYTRESAMCMCVAAVSRIMEPGYKFDTVVVLGGEQGIGKSTWIRELGLCKWYGELSSFDNKIAMEEIVGKWIIEITELGATNKQELEQQKAFLSAQSTKVRLAYERYAKEFHRQCVFIGSTNMDEFLKDSTGNRRWWPIECSVDKIDVGRLKQEVNQIWAEAFVLWAQGAQTFLSDEAEKIAFGVQEDKRESDPWKGIIESWLRTDAYVDRYSSKFGSFEGALEHREIVCLREIWDDCLEIQREPKRADTNRIAAILKSLGGWKKGTTYPFGVRYGTQKVWKNLNPF